MGLSNFVSICTVIFEKSAHDRQVDRRAARDNQKMRKNLPLRQETKPNQQKWDCIWEIARSIYEAFFKKKTKHRPFFVKQRETINTGTINVIICNLLNYFSSSICSTIAYVPLVPHYVSSNLLFLGLISTWNINLKMISFILNFIYKAYK